MANAVKMIILALLLTFLPALLCPLVLTLKGIENHQPYSPFYGFLFTMNTFLNPLLNFGRSKDMRRVLRVFFSTTISSMCPTTTKKQIQQSQCSYGNNRFSSSRRINNNNITTTLDNNNRAWTLKP